MTVLDSPIITNVQPSSARPGDEIVIVGTLFGPAQDDSTIQISGVDCAVNTWSDTRISCIVPNTTSGNLVIASRTNNVKSYGALGDGVIDQAMLMDGTIAILDAVTSTAFTVTGGVGGVWPGDSSNWHPGGLLNAYAPVIAQTTNNLLSDEDASYEGGTTGTWALRDGTTIANDATQSWHGTKSMKTTCGANASGGCQMNILALVAGDTQYTASIKIKAPVKNMRLTLGDAGPSGWLDSTTSFVGTGGWQTVNVTRTIQAGRTVAYIAIYYVGTGAAGDVFYIDAFQLEAGAVQTPFCLDSRTATTCKIATPFAAGDPLTIMAVVNTPWAGTNTGAMGLFDCRVGNTTNRIAIYAYNSSLWFVCYDSGSTLYSKSMAINASNWAANVNHVVVMTRAADGTIAGYLDNVAATTTSGTPRLESAVPANIEIGATVGSQYLNGSILTAMWKRVLSPGEIAALSEATSWDSTPNIIGTDDTDVIQAATDDLPTW